MTGVGRSVHLVVPVEVDDPAEPSGGNTYDRRLWRGLTDLGWAVHVHRTPGEHLGCVLASLEPGSVVVLDGLVASDVPEQVVPHGRRLRLVLLLHLPRGTSRPRGDAHRAEAAVVGACAAVVTPSEWCRRQVLTAYDVAPGRVLVAPPGVDRIDRDPAPGPADELLVVAAVTPHKGHDVLLAALRHLGDLAWRVRCVGPLTRDAGFAARLTDDAARAGLAERFLLLGPRTGPDLDAAYAGAGLLVLPSRGETYGMVVTEALAHGLPVIASAVGGVPEALGPPQHDRRAGLLVPPGDSAALAAALRRWSVDPVLRSELRAAALVRRESLIGWTVTAQAVARVLSTVSQDPRGEVA